MTDPFLINFFCFSLSLQIPMSFKENYNTDKNNKNLSSCKLARRTMSIKNTYYGWVIMHSYQEPLNPSDETEDHAHCVFFVNRY